MSDTKRKKTGMFLLIMCPFVAFITAQVTFSPDSEEDVQLQNGPLTPPVEVATVKCYSSSPMFKVEFVSVLDYEIVISMLRNGDTFGFPIPGGSTCGDSKNLYRIKLSSLQFVDDPVLIGGTFRLKATLDYNYEDSTFSNRTYTFPAPFNLTGSSESAELYRSFTWTCHVTSDFPTLEWGKDTSILGLAGLLPNGSCVNSEQNDSYTYNCQPSALTYTLTIPASSMTTELQGSLWRCRDAKNDVKGSKYTKLNIIVPVSNVTISPGSGSALNANENQIITFTCITNDANPSPTILWLVGSSDVTSKADSKTSTLTLKIRWSYHKKSVKCVAWNTANTANLSDSTLLNVRSSAKFQTKEYYRLTQHNRTAFIEIQFYCNPPATLSGVSWINKTGMVDEPVESSEMISFSLVDDAVNFVIGHSNVSLRGQKAVMNITSVQTYHRGYYVLRIQNSPTLTASWGVMLDVKLRPDPPRNLTVQCRDGIARLSWSFYNNLGLDMSFRVLYKEKGEEKYTMVEKNENRNAGNSYVEYQEEVMVMKPMIIYYFKVASKNINGLSKYTDTNACVMFDDNFELSATVASAGRVAGGITGVFLVLITVLIAVMVVRERRYRIEKETKAKENKASFENYDDVLSTTRVDEQGTETGQSPGERSTYEELQTSRDAHTYDHVDNRIQYQNLQLL